MEIISFFQRQLQSKFDFMKFCMRDFVRDCSDVFSDIKDIARINPFAHFIQRKQHYEIKERIQGKTVVVTGCSSGIGKATAKELYKAGGRVIMACIDIAEAERTAEEIREEIRVSHSSGKTGELVVRELDLTSLESIRSCAEEIKRTERQIHILINNAGILPGSRRLTKDGFEHTYVTNYLGHFYLTCLLLPKILASTPARIVNVSSKSYEYGRIHWNDLTLEKDFSPIVAYAQSKLALILFTRELASRLKGTGVTAYSLHPGIAKGTDITKAYDTTFISGLSMRLFFFFYGAFMKTPKEGAATTLFCALDGSLVDESGFYYEDCKRKEMTSQARSDADARRLWVESLKLVGLEELYVDKILKSSPSINSNL